MKNPTVSIIEYSLGSKTGDAVPCIMEEWFDDNGFRHRDDGPALLIRDKNTESLIEEVWSRHGHFHREDGPAITQSVFRGGVSYTHYCWMCDRFPYRLDGPCTYTICNDTGITTSERWVDETSRTGRNGHPAVIERDPKTGVIVEEGWYRKDALHREDGPAKIFRDRETGQIMRALYYVEGRLVPDGLTPSAPSPM